MAKSLPSTKHLLASELQPLVDAFPELQLTAENLPTFRARQNAAIELGDAAAAGASRERIEIATGDQVISGLLYQPKNVQGATSGYLHIHGGGYIIGSAAASDAVNLKLCAKLGITILSVDYRLAPEHPIPAPLDDCYAGLRWLHDNAASLSVDKSRIAIGGESAGGGLAAATAILARDRGEYAICHQHLTYPMLDSRTGRPGYEGDPLVGEFVWTRALNVFGWDSILGNAQSVAPQVPALVEDCSGLPPAWIHTVTLDLFRDENIAYAKRLMTAGVATELVVLPGGCHGFQMFGKTEIGARYAQAHLQALGRALS